MGENAPLSIAQKAQIKQNEAVSALNWQKVESKQDRYS